MKDPCAHVGTHTISGLDELLIVIDHGAIDNYDFI